MLARGRSGVLVGGPGARRGRLGARARGLRRGPGRLALERGVGLRLVAGAVQRERERQRDVAGELRLRALARLAQVGDRLVEVGAGARAGRAGGGRRWRAGGGGRRGRARGGGRRGRAGGGGRRGRARGGGRRGRTGGGH
ncbi:hypothetical protein ACMHYB_60210 [Sorangium sp. So ce1128]